MALAPALRACGVKVHMIRVELGGGDVQHFDVESLISNGSDYVRLAPIIAKMGGSSFRMRRWMSRHLPTLTDLGCLYQHPTEPSGDKNFVWRSNHGRADELYMSLRMLCIMLVYESSFPQAARLYNADPVITWKDLANGFLNNFLEMTSVISVQVRDDIFKKHHGHCHAGNSHIVPIEYCIHMQEVKGMLVVSAPLQEVLVVIMNMKQRCMSCINIFRDMVSVLSSRHAMALVGS